MRARLLLILILTLAIAGTASAEDRWLSITGTVNNFRTDVRVFNPEASPAEVTAIFLPVGNVQNVLSGGVKFTVGAREMKVFDDVVTQLFGVTGLGAILLSTQTAKIVVTSRIYADTPQGTLGQFVPGLGPGQALTRGILMQLKVNAQFRTNVGVLNVANADTAVTWRLFDRNNQQVGPAKTITMKAFGVIAPTTIAGTLYFDIPAGTDLTDAWASYEATNPLIVYASVVDNGTTDPTFIPAAQDPVQ